MDKPVLQKNEIVEFFNEKGGFLSEEGNKLINEASDSTIKEAIKENKDIMRALLIVLNDSKDPYFRRKLFKVL